MSQRYNFFYLFFFLNSASNKPDLTSTLHCHVFWSELECRQLKAVCSAAESLRSMFLNFLSEFWKSEAAVGQNLWQITDRLTENSFRKKSCCMNRLINFCDLGFEVWVEFHVVKPEWSSLGLWWWETMLQTARLLLRLQRVSQSWTGCELWFHP